MHEFSGDIEPVTISDLLEVASWDRPRTSEELGAFISRREIALGSEDAFDLDS